jgi:hypothetical protein
MSTPERSSLEIVCDADFLTRERAMIATLAADGIDLGQPTRAYFTLEDCQRMLAYVWPTCADCGVPLADWQADRGWSYCLECQGPPWDTTAERDGLR